MSNPNYSKQEEQKQAEKEAIKTRRQESERARHEEQENIRRMEEANKGAREQKINNNAPEKEGGYIGFIRVNPNDISSTVNNINKVDKELNNTRKIEEEDKRKFEKFTSENPNALDEGVYKGYIHVNPKKRPDGKINIENIEGLEEEQSRRFNDQKQSK